MILIMGMPGAGKSVQSGMLQERLDMRWTSTGRLLRALNEPELNAVLERGDLVDDDIVHQVLVDRLSDVGYDKDFLLDGFPRNVEQAKWLLEHVDEMGVALHGILFLDLDEEDALQRMKSRGRKDDVEHVLENRKREYQKVLPTIEYLKSRGVAYHHIDAGGAVDEVYGLVESAVKKMSS